ncbi:MAG TPA: hypothetical protein VGV38_16220 [Pyrinomonadaceae bacterium]|nr:hypothetical protein [Pyrinomonadaceae bacterium]
MKGLKSLAFAVVFFASLIPAFAQSNDQRRYEVLRNGARLAVVTASASKDAVIVSIYRQGQAAHHYRAYPPVETITVQVGRQKIFTYYINLERVDVKVLSAKQDARVADESFSVDLLQVSGPERRRDERIAAIRARFEEDMHILRAVRGYDKNAHVLLAELAYVVLTHDDSVMDRKPPASLIVREAARSAAAGGGRKGKAGSKSNPVKFVPTQD